MFSEYKGLSATADVKEHVRQDQLERFLTKQIWALVSQSIAAVAAVLLLAGSLSNNFLGGWLAMIAATNASRIVFSSLIQQKRLFGGRPLRAMRALALFALVSGCQWAVLPLVVGDIGQGPGALLIALVVALTAGGVLHGMGFALSPVCFAAPILLAIVYRLASIGGVHHGIAAAIFLYYIYFLIVASRWAERDFTDMARLKNEAIADHRAVRLYESVMRGSPFGMFIATPDARVIDANPAVCRMFGCTLEEMLDDGVSKFTHPENMDETLAAYEKLARGETDKITLEKRNLRANGEVFWTYSERTLLRDEETGEPAYIVVQLEDIDERKRNEIELKNALMQQKQAAELAALGEFRCFLGSSRTVWNDRLYEIFGVDRDYDTSKQGILRAVHPEDRESLRASMEARRSRPDTASTRDAFRIVRPSGEIRYLEMSVAPDLETVDGEPMHIGVISDVTDQVLFTRRLEDEKAKLGEALTRSQIAIDVAGLGEFHFEETENQAIWSDRLYAIFGVDRTFDTSFESFLSTVHPGDRERVRNDVESNAGSPNIAPFISEFRIVRPSGEIRHVRFAVSAKPGPSGKGLHFVGVVSDITDQVLFTRRLEDEKAKLARALAHSRMTTEVAGLGTFEYDIDADDAQWDSRMCAIFGVEQDAYPRTSQAWFAMVHPDDQPRIAEERVHIEDLKNDFESRYSIVRPSGEVRHVQVRGTRVSDEAGRNLLVGAVLDVTDQTRIMEALAEERASLDKALTRIQMAAGVARLGTFEYQLEEDRSTWDRRACEIYGADPENYDGSFTGWFELIHPEDREYVLEVMNEARRNQADAAEFTYRLLHPSGEQRHLQVASTYIKGQDGMITSVLGAVRDITDQVHVMEMLDSERSLLAATLKSVGDAIIRTDTQGRIEYMNRAACELSDRSLDEALGAPFSETFQLRTNGGVEVGAMFQEDAQPFLPEAERYSAQLICPRGKLRHVEVSVQSLQRSSGEVMGSVVVLHDVTAEMERLEELHEAKELAQVTIHSASEGIVRTDAQGRITLCNPVAARLAGAVGDDLVGRIFSDVFKFARGLDTEPIDDPMATVLNNGKPLRLNSTLRLVSGADGGLRVNLSIAPMLGTDKRITGTVSLIQDASEIATLTDRLRRQAYSDELTGLANRRGFEERLEHSLLRAGLDGRQDFLLIIDLDHFKMINDVCGHAAGDRLLVDIAQIFTENARENDFVARLGGDEFALIIEDTDEEGVCAIGDRIIAAIDAYRLNRDSKTFRVGASVGIAEIRSAADISVAMVQADTACLTAKNTGRGRYHVFRPNDATIIDMKQSQDWYHRILHGLENGAFRLYLQQVVSQEREVVGYETLLRFVHEGKVYSPGAFLEAARRHDLLTKIDRHVFKQVIDMMNHPAVREQVFQERYISVNLSAASVADHDFRDWLTRMVEQNPLVSDRLWLELTETDRLRWSEQVADFMSRLRTLGVRFFLDDFGTGYNSFDILKKVMIDGLKIDHSVVRNVMADPVDQALVQASLIIAHTHDLDIVAEGIEDEASFNYLCNLGVRKFQGYYFHKPEDVMHALGSVPENRVKKGA